MNKIIGKRTATLILSLLMMAGSGAGCAGCDSDSSGSANNGTGGSNLLPSEFVEVTEASGSTSESGQQASFELVLLAAPRADVSFELVSSDPGEGTLVNAPLVFTPDNWNAPQTVTVTGADDDLADGEQPYSVQFEVVTSDDARFDGLELPSVEVRNIDDETAGITTTAADGDTTEAGGQASLTVVLNSAPTADVTLSVESSNDAEGTVNRER